MPDASRFPAGHNEVLTSPNPRMYSFRISNGSHRNPRPFDNRSLLNAVRHISGSLVKRAGISSGDSTYATLLADIWGQSQYATLDVLIRKRSQTVGKRARHSLGNEPGKETWNKQVTQANGKEDLNTAHTDKKNAARDQLVRLLRRVKIDKLATNEHRLTVMFASKGVHLDVNGMRKLWGVPQVIFETTGLDAYLAQNADINTICKFYDCYIARRSPDSRIFNILYWKENPQLHFNAKAIRYHQGTFRCVSRGIVAEVIRLLLTKRRSPFFEKNMDVVIEVVLYHMNPDGFVNKFRESAFREACFFQGVQCYEYSRSFSGVLENLQLGKLNRMLKDIRAIKSMDNMQREFPEASKLLSMEAVSKYCAERDTLTNRALRGVFCRYVKRRRLHANAPLPLTMTETDFVRMYLALVGSGTDSALKYWFSILDQDGDGWIGPGDVAHFYAERKLESEKRNGILLADKHCVWIRFCAMGGVSPRGKGLSFCTMKELCKEDREFLMCALLVRRADNGNLIDVAGAIKAG